MRLRFVLAALKRNLDVRGQEYNRSSTHYNMYTSIWVSIGQTREEYTRRIGRESNLKSKKIEREICSPEACEIF